MGHSSEHVCVCVCTTYRYHIHSYIIHVHLVYRHTAAAVSAVHDITGCTCSSSSYVVVYRYTTNVWSVPHAQ